MPKELEKLIEALLFESSDGYTVAGLAQLLERDRDEIEEALADLAHNLKAADRGILLLRDGEQAMLATVPEAAAILRQERKRELASPLTPASLETLTVVLYLGPIEKKHIDYIRGVNSQSILRILQVRDLIKKERYGNVIHYTGTLSLLRYLGVERVSDLPDYESVRGQFSEALAVKDGEEKP